MRGGRALTSWNSGDVDREHWCSFLFITNHRSGNDTLKNGIAFQFIFESIHHNDKLQFDSIIEAIFFNQLRCKNNQQLLKTISGKESKK